jgi:hypothetical protein
MTVNDKHFSFDSIVGQIQRFTDHELSQWLIRALDKRSPEMKNLPTRWERHTFIEKLYKKLDSTVQIKFSNALSHALEHFEPELKPREGDPRYLYSLLSLAAVIRNEQIKERLRRWLYLGLFHNWEYKIFNLHGVLILTTCAYDSDETWRNHLMNVLPTKAYFRKVALETYRAILQTRKLDCVELLPDILSTAEPENEDLKERFGYLLSETIGRFGQEFFFARATAALNSGAKDVAQVCSNVLKFEDFLEEAFRDGRQLKYFKEWIKHLDEVVWKPAQENWREMEDEESKKVFDRILDKCRDYITPIPRAFVRYDKDDDNEVLSFRGTHEIVVNLKEQAHLRPFFENLAEYEKAQDPIEVYAEAAAG